MKIIFLMSVLILVSCGGDSDSPGEALKAYCIRECVLETADAEMCDTRCGCAVDKLATQTSADGLREIEKAVTQSNNADPGDGGKLFKEAFESCGNVIE